MTFKLLRCQMRCALTFGARLPRIPAQDNPAPGPAGEHRAAPFEFVRKPEPA